MLQNGLNCICDAFWGSSGKGKISAWLARRFTLSAASACNAPNAGHTVLIGDKRTVFKCLPSAAAADDRVPLLLGPGSVIDPERLDLECQKHKNPLIIHPRAVRWLPRHAEAEAELKSIASTRQGAGAALVDKVMRRDVLWGGRDEIWRAVKRESIGGIWLHEIAQGFALSIDHGSHYPKCTSRNCTPQAALDQLGVPIKHLASVGMILRPFPIRVGNDGEHSSGGWYPDQEETDWEDVAATAGMPSDEIPKLLAREHTTVTKRLRRVADFSVFGLRHAVEICAPDYFVLNFAQYIDWGAAGVREFNRLPPSVRRFIDFVEKETNVPTKLVGTGEDIEDMVEVP